MTREPDFLWNGSPVFRCSKGCGPRFERVGRLDQVLAHEAGHATARVSPIAGPAGEAVIVTEVTEG